MDMAIRQSFSADTESKIKAIIGMFKISKLEQMLSDALEGMPDKSPVDYIGDLNRADVMH